MALNLGSSGGDFLPFLKYNAKAGRFYKRVDKTDVEVPPPSFVADLGNIKTGWFAYAEGQAPSIVYDANLSTPALKPSDKHKRGFKFNIFGKDPIPGVMEFSSASMHACASLNEVYTIYEAEAPKNDGKMPVIQCTGVVPQKDAMGTNYKPTFVISKWVDAPQELKDICAPVPANQPTTAPSKAVSEF